jgi:hypothetical protein
MSYREGRKTPGAQRGKDEKYDVPARVCHHRLGMLCIGTAGVNRNTVGYMHDFVDQMVAPCWKIWYLFILLVSYVDLVSYDRTRYAPAPL